MVRLDKIYTRGGDAGETSLADGRRVAKHNARVAACGTVDEANATLGLVRLEISAELDSLLAQVQNDLFDLGADLATPINGKRAGERLQITESQVAALERVIDLHNAALAPLKSFVLPGGSRASAYLHLARTVVRRAERDVSALAADEPINGQALIYLNRLSDLLFVLARALNRNGAGDTLWVPGQNR